MINQFSNGNISAKEFKGDNKFEDDILDSDGLWELQNVFSNASKLYISCFRKSKGVVTPLSGTSKEIEEIDNLIGKELYLRILNKLMHDLEGDIIIEETGYDFIKVAGVNIFIDNVSIISWIITGILRDKYDSFKNKFGGNIKLTQKFSKITTEKQFDDSVKFLKMFSTKLFVGKYNEICANEEAKKSKLSERQIKQELKRNEAMAKIVKFLESEQSFGSVIAEILEITGKLLNISNVNVMQIDKNKEYVDMISEWTNKGIVSTSSYMQHISLKELPFLTDRTYIVSTGSVISKEVEKSFQNYNIKALITMPIETNNNIIMYINFIESRYARTWETNNIGFLNDVKKILQSIATKRITKNSLASSYISLEAILENIGCGIYVRDKDTKKTLFANQKIRSEFEIAISKGTFEQMFENCRNNNRHSNYMELYYPEINKWYDIHYTDITWVDGRFVSLCTIYDVTDRKVYQKKIEQQANNDFLTGLYNRMRCETDLFDIITQINISKEQSALIYIDIDDFKHINDGLGHQYGDILLKEISHSLRKIDSIQDSCYRMGGDEFIVIIKPDKVKDMDSILEQIKEIFSHPWYLKGAHYYCTMSMGIVSLPRDGHTVQDLIKKADIALYEAKRLGKNRIEYYNETSESVSYKRLDMEKNMRAAAANSFTDFEVYYQPIVNICGENPECVGAEALVRWNSKQLGFISPAEFIPLAEYLGLINPIGGYVLETACQTCHYWNENGYPNYKINVNLSVVQLLQNDIEDTIKKAIEKTGINPRNLTLEVTESLAINDMSRMKTVLTKIKKTGVRIALDDFGTGYSSLNHIKEIPLDVIKVDQCFINDINEDNYACAFVKMVGELAETIKVNVCVEGVEKIEQYEALKPLKVHLIQGYYFGKPMPLRQFNEKFAKKQE